MKISTFIYGFFLLILMYTGCISEFEPPSQGYENLLVVEALLSNSDEPFEVALSRSTPIDTTAFIPESRASVSLVSGNGESYDLYEYEEGRYQSNGIIMPQVGMEYKLSIQTITGGNYESEYVTMRDTPEIDSVTFAYEEKSDDLKGVQIYVDSHDPDNNTWYYRWEWDEDWNFYTPFNSSVYWDDGVYIQTENINLCWLSAKSTNVTISTTTNLTEDIVSKFPLVNITNDSDRLINKYSINVKQYSLSEESYNYWIELQKATESLGTLFDPQPSTVYGNIYNVNDEAEVVLGYFDAARVQEKRIYIKRRDVPVLQFPDYYTNCEDSLVTSFEEIENLSVFGYTLYATVVNDFGGEDYLLSNIKSCVDCRIRGTNVAPDFWQ